jgi:hypothetical protein
VLAYKATRCSRATIKSSGQPGSFVAGRWATESLRQSVRHVAAPPCRRAVESLCPQEAVLLATRRRGCHQGHCEVASPRQGGICHRRAFEPVCKSATAAIAEELAYLNSSWGGKGSSGELALDLGKELKHGEEKERPYSLLASAVHGEEKGTVVLL